ncbi:MAG: hypothetical protein R3E12_09300 [Candidatus Eisenbacteria bacterium]|uniref:Uncharacterized protein n=1 Tax=Eiseniibacteriota bacterium TaxID=2212470 RepID=A0A956RNQ4_UNCEI|nr:hypothetical protein [Candidatus Eisenbacteria bacterium]
MKLSPFLCILGFGLVFASAADAGPNANGVIVLHWNESVVYTDGTDFCGESGLESCNDAVTTTSASSTVVLHALAAFPTENAPRLAGLCFGVQYDELQIRVTDWGACGDFELHENNWPGSNQGVCITWSEAQTGHLTEICWFAAYSVYGDASELALRGHPQGGGLFADDAVPSNIDPIADYGRLGFFQDGYLPCPNPPTPVEPSSWGRTKAVFR